MSHSEKVKMINRAIRVYTNENDIRDINTVRVIVALERVVARLQSHKKLSKHIIFKGGFVLLKSTPSLRFTRDADILAKKLSKEDLIPLFKEALAQDLKDGMWYGEVEVVDLPLQGKYGACRLKFPFQIGEPKAGKNHKLPRVHVDIGFSDQVSLKPEKQNLNMVLTHESPVSWQIYPLEFTLAEKLHAFCERGSGNSRAKDLYDIALIYPLCENASDLKKAIIQTFQNRDLEIPKSLVKFATSLNLDFLKSAWPNVPVIKEKLSFEETWKNFKSVLWGIDSLF
jgi:predicted nucleotidyltransferase component of viral defense system